MRRRVEESRYGYLSTAGQDGRPHVVPVVFVVDGETVCFAVDSKPKRTTNLKRLRNIAANPSVALLVDHHEEDWSRLWWVRVDGSARLLDRAPDAEHAIDLLVEKYPQYTRHRPAGPVVAIDIQRITGWEAAGNPGC